MKEVDKITSPIKTGSKYNSEATLDSLRVRALHKNVNHSVRSLLTKKTMRGHGEASILQVVLHG